MLRERAAADGGVYAPPCEGRRVDRPLCRRCHFRDNAIEEIKRLDMLLEYAVQQDYEAEAERLREELKRLTETI